MNEDVIGGAWTTLGPTADQRRRIDRRVAAWLDARDTSLAAEWLALFRVEPWPAAGLLAASAAAVAVLPPVAWVVGALM